jgi:hypothetical protein
LGIQKFRARNPVYQEVDYCIKNALILTYEHLEHQTNFRGLCPLDPQGREGKDRERNGTEGCAPKGKSCVRHWHVTWNGASVDAK